MFPWVGAYYFVWSMGCAVGRPSVWRWPRRVETGVEAWLTEAY